MNLQLENTAPARAAAPVGVVHVVDALNIGGAEQVAINLVNLLPRDRFTPHLCTTRSEGPMSGLVQPHVTRLSLERRGRIDTAALRRFVRFIGERDIRIVHAHASALFFSTLASALSRKCALIWHDHYGRADFNDRPTWLYRMATRAADGVIAVNQTLYDWCRNSLHLKPGQVWYIPNLVADAAPVPAGAAPLRLPGEPGQRLVCVANFRPQKDHPNLLRAMTLIHKQAPGAHLFLVGDSADPDYVRQIRAQIEDLGLDHAVSYMGPRQDVAAILNACDIGVLGSASEGLPLALLEYGRAGLASVATHVGQCPEVLDHGAAGVLVPPSNPGALARAVLDLIHSREQRAAYGVRFRVRIEEFYSPRRILHQICHVYDAVLQSAK